MDTLRIAVFSLFGVASLSTLVSAQHSDILVQDSSDRLATGTADFDTNQWTLGNRTYAIDFDSNFSINNPGWNSLGVGNPAMPVGAEPLPADTGLEFDFLPMKIDGYTSNFLYWDGMGSVDFGATPTENYLFALESRSSGLVIIDGSPALKTGAVFDNTDDLGAMHTHRDWEMDDGVSGTNPVDGIYLVALRTRMDTLDRSEPFYVIFGTLGSSTAARNAAEAWVDAHLDELAPDFSADFDGDLDVDGDDLGMLETSYGLAGSGALQIAGDANFDNQIDGFDFLEWQRQAGSNLINFPGTSADLVPALVAVPEPGSIVSLMVGGICLFILRRK